jgi:hypothetical protein
MSAVMGFFGSIVGAIVTAIVVAAGLAWLVIIWKSGSLPEVVAIVTAIITGFFSAIGSFFGFLGELITFARS